MQLFKRLLKLNKNEFILHTIIVFAGTTLAGFCSFLYHLISVRILSAQEYGTLNALISFIGIASTPIAPFSTVLTRFFTEYITKEDFSHLIVVLRKLIKRSIILSILGVVIFTLLSPLIGKFLNTKSIYIVICGGVIFLSFMATFTTSLLQSFQKFILYSLVGFIGSLGKLLVGFILLICGMGAFGGLLGFIFSPLLGLLLAPYIISLLLKHNIFDKQAKTVKVDLAQLYKYFLSVFIAMMSFASLTNMDMILVKHFFSPLEAGYYSIAQVVGKIFFFAPSALAIVIFPKTTQASVKNTDPRRVLYKSLALTGLGCGVGVILAFLFPEFILKVITSHANSVSIKLVGLSAFNMSFYAGLWILINYFLAMGNTKFILPLLVVSILQIIFICLLHSSLASVIYINIFISILAVAILFLLGLNFKYGKINKI